MLIAQATLGHALCDRSFSMRPINVRFDLLREAIDGMLEVLGPNHPTTLRWQAELALRKNQTGDPQARALMSSILERAEPATSGL